MGTIEPVDLLLCLGAAALCGGLIGMERELHHKAVGLRTIMLVAIGSAVFTLTAVEVTVPAGFDRYNTTGDLGQICRGIIAGLGMLARACCCIATPPFVWQPLAPGCGWLVR
ncbi:MAG: MgtC/SapB family protein [Rhodospirillales bacterium]|nr:MgtC/SapB family protein [Rhodospirillales bacterium]